MARTRATDYASPCLTCGTPATGAYCPLHTPEYGYESPLWRRTRLIVLDRDQHRCRLRLGGCTGRATTVHRLPRYGTEHDGNLDAYLSACAHCHGVIDAPRAKQRDASRGRTAPPGTGSVLGTPPVEDPRARAR